MSTELIERGRELAREYELPCNPFSYSAYIVFNEPDLIALRAYLETFITWDNAGWERFSSLDRNFDLVHLKNAVGVPAISIIYLPIFNLQCLGKNFLAIYRRTAIYITDIAFKTAQLSGYGLDKSQDMFNHLVGNMMSSVLVIIGRYLGGNVCAASDEARFLDQNLTPEQWYYLDRLTPTALSSLARDNFMEQANGRALIENDGTWIAKTYFHNK